MGIIQNSTKATIKTVEVISIPSNKYKLQNSSINTEIWWTGEANGLGNIAEASTVDVQSSTANQLKL